MNLKRRPITLFASLLALLLALFLLYKFPSPIAAAMHTQVYHARAEIASFDAGASLPVQPVATRLSTADGRVQVFVPAGEFHMGDDDPGSPKNGPQHVVYVDAFWVDQTEVSNEAYAKCYATGACPHPGGDVNPYFGKPKYAQYPVVYVSWDAAAAYCQWAGGRLPTEAEWEKAARGTDGRAYPWGNDPPDERLANFDRRLGAALPVTRYPLGASPYGALNMAGNVREWVADWFNELYYRKSPGVNPTGPVEGDERSLRGGSFLDDARELRAFNRFSHQPFSPGINRGFRCVSDAE